jgi:hypothetical protein
MQRGVHGPDGLARQPLVVCIGRPDAHTAAKITAWHAQVVCKVVCIGFVHTSRRVSPSRAGVFFRTS